MGLIIDDGDCAFSFLKISLRKINAHWKSVFLLFTFFCLYVIKSNLHDWLNFAKAT